MATALLTACGGGGGAAPIPTTPPIPSSSPSAATPSPTPSPTPSLGSVVPSSIESGTNAAYDDPDMFGAPVATAKNKLFVYFPGTGGSPSSAQLILREGSARGYHVIGLTYVNGTEVNQYCATATDPACWGNVRAEVVYGNGASMLVSVTPADSVVGRLSALLTYLATTRPSENWGQFMTSGAPVWSKIVTGGHSQGAGDAMYLAKGQTLAGACAFDSPDDGNASAGVASWLSQPNATSLSTMYGFTNQDDAIAPFTGVTRNWSLIGLLGSPTDVDGSSAPYGGSHQLYTVAPASVTLNTHGYTVVDAATPLVNGQPIFAPVWDTICFQ